jgi:hypothetical protein
MSVITSGFYTVHDGGPTKRSYIFDTDRGFYYVVVTTYVQRDGSWKIEDSRKLFESRDYAETVRRYEALIATEPAARHSSTLQGGSAL